MSEMVFRRHRNVLQLVLVVLVIGAAVRYAYNYYQDTSIKLKAANIRRHELLKELNKANRELDVMTQRKADLEYSLKSKTLELSKFKKDCQSAKDDLENQANRDKNQWVARFNALDSEHRMLKAKRDDLQTEHEFLQRKFDRLKDDHDKVDAAHKKNYQELKEKNEKVISALQRQVEYFHKQESSLQVKVEELKATLVKYQNKLEDLKQKQRDTVKVVPEKMGGGKDNPGQSQEDGVEKVPEQILRSKTKQQIKDGNIESKADVTDDKLDDSKKGNIELQEPRNFEKPVLNNDTNVLIVPGGGKDTAEAGDSKRDENYEQDVGKKDQRQEQWKNDEQNTNHEKKRRWVEDEDKKAKEVPINNFNEANELLNNDQKFDDQELAVQEGEENDENAADGQEKNEMLIAGNDVREKRA